ncbi:hypothetical protein BaRGS_00035415 [Batillaria attramentaria]|uniref:RNA helicase n=1 Tax=Batillaria attramentaria TaxID=370345 RepID=A0ABD0JEV6_9CAEN
MDLEDICTVENENELKQYVSQPKHEIHTCKKRAKDGFRRVIESLMETIEDRMMTCSFVENHRDKDLLKMNLKAPEYHRTYQRYAHWLGKLGSYLVRMANDREAYSQFFSSAEMLRRYHQALILNEDCESQYALNYLLDQIREMEEAGQLTNLQRVVLDAADYNPKLSMLEGILGQIQEQHEVRRHIVHGVRADTGAIKAIKVWMEGHPDLKHLNPGRITGNSKPACDGGMSINAAAEVMKDFNMGKHKVVVCTSAAEEGLDFQACSAVIRYDYVTSMISMIQTRGRARRKDSQYFILGDETRGNVPREMIHLAAERLMNQAVETFQTLMNTISNQFRNEVRERQRREKNQRLQEAEMKKYSEEQRRAEVNGAVYNLYCRKCQRPACSSDEVRLYAVNTRMVISNDFQHKWKRAERKRPDQVFQNLRIVGKLHCRGCSFDWGCLARYIPTEKEFPVIKLDSFILENRRNRDDAAGMVFVRTLELSKAVQKWIEVHPDLKNLAPGRITGSRKSNKRPGGMTKNEVADVLTDFNSGKHKVVVCTSAAEEGLDFQSCNVVVRYDYVTHMISMIQTRGRARQKDSEYWVLGNQLREIWTRKWRTWLANVQAEMESNTNSFLYEMDRRQRLDLAQRQREAEEKQRKRRAAQDTGEVQKYNLKCRK